MNTHEHRIGSPPPAQAIQRAAQLLRDAAASGVPCQPVRELLPAADAEVAYAVQQCNTEHDRSRGRRVAGRKIGLTSASVQKQLGVNQPDYGMLFADMAFADGEDIPWSRLMQPKAECEIALVLETDLVQEQPTVVDLIRATAYALPAIEVVGSRIANWQIGLVDTIADNASSGVFVLGTVPVKLDAFDPRLCGMVMERRGDQVSLGAGAACLGNPLTAAAWLARKMAEVGMPLKAGDVLLTGALGPMVPVSPGDVLECRISGLGSLRAVFGEGAAA